MRGFWEREGKGGKGGVPLSFFRSFPYPSSMFFPCSYVLPSTDVLGFWECPPLTAGPTLLVQDISVSKQTNKRTTNNMQMKTRSYANGASAWARIILTQILFPLHYFLSLSKYRTFPISTCSCKPNRK